MPHVTQALTSEGAVVELQIGVSAARRLVLVRNGLAVPGRVRIKAQIDTGAELSAVDARVFPQLSILPIDRRQVRTVSASRHPEWFDYYLVSIGIEGPELELHLPAIEVISCEFGDDENARALLGRDLLAHCLFVYDGQARTFALSF